MTAMAASIGVDSKWVHVEVIRVAGLWHRRVKLGAFDWWKPDQCVRDATLSLEERGSALPRTESVCRACWPVWPAIK